MRNIKFDRRSLLRGLGYGTVLCSGLSKNLYAQTMTGRTMRLAMFAYANGSHPDSNHMMATGETFTLTPHMAPLEPMKSQLTIIKRATLERGSGNSHKSTSFSVFGLGATTSFDQTVADFVKATTPIPSLEYSIGVTTGGGGVIPGLSQRNGSFLPGLRTPVSFYQKVAERVTGGAPPPPTGGSPTPPMTTPTGAEGALLRRKSLLDWVKSDVDTFRSRLGPDEKKKFDAYAESLRTLERDIGNGVPVGGGGEPIKPTASCTKIAAPGSTLSAMTRVNDMPMQNPLYLDVIAMAFACNVTRVASAMWGGGQSDEPVRFDDINMGNWHSTSHNDPKGGGGQQMIKVQAFMAKQLLYFMGKLQSYADGQFSLLDNTAAVLSTQNGCSTQVAFAPMDHPKQNCPLIIGGGAAGAWKPGKVVDANGRNHNDAYLSIAQAFKMPVTTVGNAAWCKGPLIT